MAISTFSSAVRRLEGKVALITGGATGIGEYTAKFFAKHGAKVIIADIQDEIGQSVCNDIGSSSASYVHCNVTNEEHVKNAVDSAMIRHGKLDIMYNNAGIAGMSNLEILDNNLHEFKEMVDVNLTGPFLGTKHAARVMIPVQQGSIITAASISSVIGGVTSHAYVSSKHGVIGLMKNTAVELGRYGIRVNALSSHVVPTPMVKKFFNLDEEGVSKVYSNLKGATCTLEDIAEATLFLASDESKFISGHNLVVDGGFTVMNKGFCMFE